jgi:hypothetical protein
MLRILLKFYSLIELVGGDCSNVLVATGHFRPHSQVAPHTHRLHLLPTLLVTTSPKLKALALNAPPLYFVFELKLM